MGLPLTQCPDCNSRQRFATKRRKIGGRIEVYIHCYACGYESVIERMTFKEWLEHSRERVHRLRALRRSIR